ncbi:hypothetical protein ILUMI_15984 [Ignelater luminosus]|uniref:Uncharacterized protein n=1 Tax=Ignelater luminosus TaxID=2038154 RepID=A0A8K0G8L5_IGNLU|nr:hypothetical protein ILUMI_15984 [Ignelater luminosus]
MPNLTEHERIEILVMVGYADRLRRSGRETKLNILLEAEENPLGSTRQLLLNNDTDHSTAVKLFKHEKYHLYKMHLIRELNENDSDRRLQFCEDLMLRCDRDPNFLNNIFYDKATFCLNGTVS